MILLWCQEVRWFVHVSNRLNLQSPFPSLVVVEIVNFVLFTSHYWSPWDLACFSNVSSIVLLISTREAGMNEHATDNTPFFNGFNISLALEPCIVSVGKHYWERRQLAMRAQFCSLEEQVRHKMYTWWAYNTIGIHYAWLLHAVEDKAIDDINV